jgi:thiol-disulfide isomerase/thioredoxin
MLTGVYLLLSMQRILQLLTCFFTIVNTTAAQNIPALKMADVAQRINQPNDTTYIINFWATFCKPCVEEMPGLLKVAEKYKTQKVKLLLVSLDLSSYYPKRIAAFVTKNKWKASIAWLNETNADYFCPMIDSSWSGAIPATVVVNAKREYKKFWEGEVSEVELTEAIEFATTPYQTSPLKKNEPDE